MTIKLPSAGCTTILPGATSLSFIVAATQIGVELQIISAATSAALVGAGLLSAVLFPPIALSLLQRSSSKPVPSVPDQRAEASSAARSLVVARTGRRRGKVQRRR
jgi:hypothetical protein